MTAILPSDQSNIIEQRLSEGRATQSEITHFLVVHYYATLHRLALSLLSQSEEAADVAQQTIIKAAAKIDQYQPGTNFKAWVFKIAVNEARMAIRRNQARQRLKNILTLGLQADSQPLPPEAQMILSERDRSIWKAVSELPTKQKLPVLLRYSFGLTDQEISEILEVPHGTVRSRLHNAHKKLFVMLAKQEVKGLR